MDSFKIFIDKWTNPSLIVGFLVVTYGAIVWGNNLTAEALQAAKERGEQVARLEILENNDQAHQISMAEMTLILKQLTKQLEETQIMVIEHSKEAEQWKRRIIVNEQNR